MDWERKTARREALVGAAADTFNEMVTPAQTLLRTLQVRCCPARACNDTGWQHTQRYALCEREREPGMPRMCMRGRALGSGQTGA